MVPALGVVQVSTNASDAANDAGNANIGHSLKPGS
jgi:hypothetical protein